MQYKVKSLITDNYLNNILKDRGIEEPIKYLNPTLKDIEEPINLDNIQKGYLLLQNHILNHSKIALLVDCDCDGYTSAAIIYNFLKAYYNEVSIDYYIHEGKQHGLEDQIDNLINKNYGLIIIPDAGSNDFEQQKALNDTGTDILILDHHLVDNIDEDYYLNNNQTIIINNQLSKDYKNKALSGAGVTWQFCKYYEEMILDWAIEDNPPEVEKLMDLAAVGIIGDCMDMRTYENRAFSHFGLSKIYNNFLKAIIKKQSFSLKKEENISPIGVGFYIAPIINSIIRVGSNSEKEKMFMAFINGNQTVPSTKKGAKNEFEILSEQVAREGTNAKNRQDIAVTKAIDVIDMELQSTGALDNNLIIIADITDTNVDIPSTLNGLVAMKLASKYKKPVLVVRQNDEGFLRGSARNDGKSEFKDFRSFLLDSNYFEYAQGHENAFGVSIENKKIDKFLSYANSKLKNLNFNDNFYEVEYAVNGLDNTLKDFIFEVYKDDTLWGQYNNTPLICSTGLKIKPSDLQVCGTRKDTLRFKYNGITYIKFFATSDIEKLLAIKNDEIILTVIGEGAINEWGGMVSPQIIIKDYEIGGTIYDF